MTIFKKNIRTWLALILTLLIMAVVLHYSAAFAFRSDAKEIKSDPGSASILDEIHKQNLDPVKVGSGLS